MSMTSSNNSSGGQATLISLLLAIIILAGLWFGPQLLKPQDGQTASAPSVTVTAESWPTREPTFTPISVSKATLVPTIVSTPSPVPTVIVIDKQKIGNLESFAVKMSTVRFESVDVLVLAGFTLPKGKDTVTVEYYATVIFGVSVKDIDFKVQGNSVIVMVPRVKVLSVEPIWNRMRIIDSDASFLNSNIQQVVTNAWANADTQIRNVASVDRELNDLAQSHTELLIKDHLYKLGFQNITINSK
jgi:hypothetical protein